MLKNSSHPWGKQINHLFRRNHWPNSIDNETIRFTFQDFLLHTYIVVIKNTEHPLLNSMLKVLYLFRVQFEIKYDVVVSLWTRCINCCKRFHCDVTENVSEEIIPVLSKLWFFSNVGISSMIQSQEQIYFLLMMIFLVGVTVSLCLMQWYVTTFIVQNLKTSLLLFIKIGLSWCVVWIFMTRYMKRHNVRQATVVDIQSQVMQLLMH